MSAITIENDLVHYEVLGRGRPVIFVHGWLGSWRYWVPTMQQLSVKYRTYALDLWGYGDSGKDAGRYGFKEQVQLLNNFMDKLGITKAALVGHSLGAALCLRFASQYPDRAPRVALISPPLFDLGGLDADVPMQAPKPTATPAPATVTPESVTLQKPPDPATVSGSIPVPSPAPATPTPAPVAPVPTAPAPATPTAPAASTPSVTPAVPAPNAAPTTTGSPVAPATPPTPASAAGSATPAAPATLAASGDSAATMPAKEGAPGQPPNTDTIPRNPFRGLGDTPEEILARLQAKNVVSAGSTSAPAPQPAKPAAPASPALPTGIGTPILPKAGSPAPAPAANPTSAPAPTPVPAPTATPAPARTEAPNPLLKLLNSNPVELLNKFVDRDTPDLDKLLAEVKKSDEQVLTKSATSFNGLNLAVELQRLSVPVLLLHGKDDPILPAPSDEMLMRINKSKPAGHLLAFVEPELHHFPMLEITAKFDRLLMDFFDAQDLSNVQFKDQWRRTMR